MPPAHGNQKVLQKYCFYETIVTNPAAILGEQNSGPLLFLFFLLIYDIFYIYLNFIFRMTRHEFERKVTDLIKRYRLGRSMKEDEKLLDTLNTLFLDFNSTVENEIAFGLESLGLPGSQIDKRIGKICEVLHIEDLLDRSPMTLSGGEKRLVSIASVLCLNPSPGFRILSANFISRYLMLSFLTGLMVLC